MAEIKVLFFGPLREALSKDSLIVFMDSPTPAKIKQHLIDEHHKSTSNLQDVLNSSATVVNLEYCDPDHLLKHRDELAFIPPVSAG
jgi:molybdopterin converting factor small subunit